MPEFLYNEEVELDIAELMDTEEEIFEEPEEEITAEELLEATAEEESSEKKKKLVSDIESGNVEAGHGAEGDYAISKNVAEEEENNEDVVDEAPLEVDSSGDSSPTIEEVDNVEDFTKPTDSIPEKKISVSIEHLRKKMEEEK